MQMPCSAVASRLRALRLTVVCHDQEENVRRKEHAAKRKAVETGKVDADAAGGAKRQRMW